MDTRHEYLAGTDPTNALSRLRLQPGTEHAGLGFWSVTGRLYGLDVSRGLVPSNRWHAVTNDLPGTGGFMTLEPSSDSASGSYYRINVRPPSP
jgi:hypothetical protein